MTVEVFYDQLRDAAADLREIAADVTNARPTGVSRSNATYGKLGSCKRPFNSDGSEIIHGPGSSSMSAGFSIST